MTNNRKTLVEELRERDRRNGRPKALEPGERPASEYDDRPPADRESTPEPPDTLPIVTCGELLCAYPERRPAVIEGLLRAGETMNVIAAPKIGKSWLTLGLAFAVATGRPWLSSFQTTQSNVLLIDNELHPETGAHRLRTLAQAVKLPEEQIAKTVSTVNLRGRLVDLAGIGAGLRRIERGRFNLVIIDAFYRTLPARTDENDNGTVAGLYNLLDCYAEATGASFVLIHHASKGDQSAKAVTDVGAGAGAQSRATDTHLILRPHEEPDAVVLDGAVRSWPPVDPLCLRWSFPVWSPAPDLDPTALRMPPKPRKRKPESQEDPNKPAALAWTAKRFAEAFGSAEPKCRDGVLEDARLAGLSDSKAEKLLKAALGCDFLFSWKVGGANSKTLVAAVLPPEPPAPEIATTTKLKTSVKRKRPRKRKK